MATQSASTVFLAYVNLTRLRIAGMIVLACAIGFILSYSGDFPAERFFWTLLGTGLLSAGSCTLNCWMERDADARMPRTCSRPLPAGVISPGNAFAFGLLLVASGCSLLFFQANLLASLLGLSAVVIYLAIYTPAKKITWMNTSIGAIPGAIPPLIGWAAARGQIDFAGWVLFAMMFIWQHTHFYPIAWLFRSDYQQAGFQMLPVLETEGQKTFLFTLLTAIALLPISMLLCGTNLTGYAYFVGAGLFGVLLILASVRLNRQPSRAAAHAVLFLSLLYLPAIFAAVIMDRYGTQVVGHMHAWLETVCRWT